MAHQHHPKNQFFAFLNHPRFPIALLLLALAGHLLYFTELRHTLPGSFVDQPFCGVDAVAHHERALGLLSGQYPGDDPWLFIPLYPAFLALLYRSVDAGFYLPVIIQSILNLVTYASLYGIGTKLFSRTVGALACLALVAYAPYTYYVACFDQALLTVPLLTLTLFLLLKFQSHGQLRWLAVAALTTALSSLSRPTVLIALPAVTVWLFLYRASLQQFFVRSVCFVGLVLLFISPITWHNYQTTGLFILLSKNGGVNIFTGNNPDATGLDSLAHAQSQPAVLRHVALQDRRRSGETTYINEVLTYIRQQPGDWLELTLTKVRLWFVEADKPLISPFFPLAIEDSWLLRRLPIEWQAAVLVALLGLLLVPNRNRSGAVLIWLIYGFFSLATILFFIQLRFRLPFVPIVLLYSAALTAQGYSWLRRKSKCFWLVLAALLTLYPWLPTLGIFIFLYAGLALIPAFKIDGDKRYRWIAVALWSYLILGVFWSQTQAAAVDVSQTIGHYLGPKLVGSGVLGQTFEMDCNNFDHLAIELGVFDQPHSQPIQLTLATDPASSETLFSTEFDGNAIYDQQWLDFSFEPIPNSQGHSYFFFISSPSSTPEDSLTARGYTDTPIDQYKSGQAYAGELNNLQRIEADFAFVATCRQSFGEKLVAGIERMASEQLFWISWVPFYWGVLIVHVGMLTTAAFLLITEEKSRRNR
ncbi:MAG: glycosyltransferase family 39 protein [Anaerolineae bacterium]|nr:glycosyltransferase family 39 protein [Anaerolineae bacterium]